MHVASGAEFQSLRHHTPAHAVAARGIIENEPPEMSAKPRPIGAAAVDDHGADDHGVVEDKPGAVRLRVEALKKRRGFGRDLGFKKGPEAPFAGLVASMHFNQTADAAGLVSFGDTQGSPGHGGLHVAPVLPARFEQGVGDFTQGTDPDRVHQYGKHVTALRGGSFEVRQHGRRRG